MPTHHSQTALRSLDQVNENEDRYGAMALVHSQLETAAQIERLADMAEGLATEMSLAMKELGSWIMGGGIARFISQANPFTKMGDPE